MKEELPIVMGLCLVDFHHTRGPEVEYWCGLPEGTDENKIFPNLPFQALPDGSHSFKETFIYFTLLYNERDKCSPPNGATDIPEDELKDCTTLFAISCSRQIRSDDLTYKEKDITRSTVQKAVVVISRQPIFGQIKDKVSLVTNAFFLQRNFSDKTIISSLYENLMSLFKTWDIQDGHLYLGLSLRRLIYDFKKDALFLLKALLLERQIIFYGNNVEALCNVQFGLISLIPNLLSNLQNSGSPLLHKSLENLKVADSFRSSDRQSVLRFLGFPLLIFEQGGLFSPYTPLQQMQDIKSENTSFFMIGSSNSLLAERKGELCEIFVNVDDSSVEIIDKSLTASLALSNHDKKWMDSIVNAVISSWNENDLDTPRNSQFEGSEDFIRWQFEDYLTGLLSSIKLSDYIASPKENDTSLQSIPEDLQNSHPIQQFNSSWVQKWRETQNFKIFNTYTDDRIFDLFPPKHAYNAIDPFTAFQHKLATTFQNLKKNNGSSDGIKPRDSSLSSEKQQKDGIVTKTTSTISSAASSAGDKEPSMWNTWKDYFKERRKNKKKEAAEASVNPTQHLEYSQSTNDAIDSALVGLGLYREEDEENNISKEEVDVEGEGKKEQSGAPAEAEADLEAATVSGRKVKGAAGSGREGGEKGEELTTRENGKGVRDEDGGEHGRREGEDKDQESQKSM